MSKPLRYQENAEEIILNMDEELFKMKRDYAIVLVIGLVLFWTIVALVIVALSAWVLYSLYYRLEKMEIWLREKYEKQARKKGKRLVITYNPKGQQFYPR